MLSRLIQAGGSTAAAVHSAMTQRHAEPSLHCPHNLMRCAKVVQVQHRLTWPPWREGRGAKICASDRSTAGPSPFGHSFNQCD